MSTDHSIKLCECGCGRPTLPYTQTSKAQGKVKGKPARFLLGHNTVKAGLVLTGVQREILIGSLLGDGCIVNPLNSPGSNCRFSKVQTHRHKEYLDWHYRMMEPLSKALRPVKSPKLLYIDGNLSKSTTEIQESFDFRTSNAPIFNDWRKCWYPAGKKIVPRNFDLTPLIVAIWFCDDGVNNQKDRLASFCTDCFTYEECRWLNMKLAVDLNISSSIHRHFKGRPHVCIRQRDYFNFMAMIRPHVPWKCFAYKVDEERARKGKAERIRVARELFLAREGLSR